MKYVNRAYKKIEKYSAELVKNEPTINIVGKNQVYIENYKNIVFYDYTEIIIKSKLGNIVIEGDDLYMKEMSAEKIIVSGYVKNVGIR